MTTLMRKNIEEGLVKHALWLHGSQSEPAPPLRDYDFRGADLRGVNLSRADLSYAHLEGADLTHARLDLADLSSAKLHDAMLMKASMRGTKAQYARFDGACLHSVEAFESDFGNATLINADLSCANFVSGNFRGSWLMDADLDCTVLDGAQLENANLSGAVGVRSPLDCLQEWFQWFTAGFVAYKAFGLFYTPPSYWHLREGATIRESGLPNRNMEEGSGIHMTTKAELAKKMVAVHKHCPPTKPVWEILVPFESFFGVVVPYNSVGDIRVVDADVKLSRQWNQWEVDELWRSAKE